MVSYRASFRRKRRNGWLHVVFASRLAVKRQLDALDSLPEVVNLGFEALQLPVVSMRQASNEEKTR